MSPASKSRTKTKDKASANTRAAKEQRNALSKNAGSVKPGNGSPASAYNPTSGTFHSLDTEPVVSSPPLLSNGLFQNIDDDTHSGSSRGTAAEYDSLSNNGSCSGESEDQKEKVAGTALRQETIPGSDNDKREKIRQKNEKKHQRQKERRALELHDRCCGYLMSRKLESLSLQLVAMGFSSERATLALVLNEGKVEESVNWLFEGSENEAPKTVLGDGANLKIDVGEELARIVALEVKYKCSKQEVERAVVACEGDLDKAEESLKAQKLEPPATPPKLEEKANVKISMRMQEKPAATVATQLSRNEKDIHYGKRAVAGSTLPQHGSVSLLGLQANQPTQKMWPVMGSSSSVSYSMASPLQVASSSAKMLSQGTVIVNEGSNLRPGVVREPIVMMQRPPAQNINQNPVTSVSVSPPGANGWYPKNVSSAESMKLKGRLHNQITGSFDPESLNLQHLTQQTEGTRTVGPEHLSSHPFYPQTQYMKHMSKSADPAEARPGIPRSAIGASSPSLKVPSSLGLFSSWGSTGMIGSSSQSDWNRVDMSHCDYNSIDWSLSLESKYSSSSANGSMSMRSNRLMPRLSPMRIESTSGIGFVTSSLQDDGMAAHATSSTSSREWTSPFAGKDIFSVPREFVISPSR